MEVNYGKINGLHFAFHISHELEGGREGGRAGGRMDEGIIGGRMEG